MIHKAGSFILLVCKAAMIIALVAMVFYIQERYYIEELFYFWGNVVLLVLYTAFLYLAGRVYNGFNYRSSTVVENVISWILCLIIADVFQYLIVSLLSYALVPIEGFVILFGAQILLVMPMTIILNRLYFLVNPAQTTLIIYGDIVKLQGYKKMIAQQRREFKVTDTISQYDHTGTILDLINNAQAVFFLDVEDLIQEGLLEYCYLNDKHVYVIPTFSRVLYNTADTIWLSKTPVFSLKKPEPDMGTLFLKRLMDIVISVIAIIVTSPLMLIVWLAVRLHDGHPAIYKQERITQGGKRFNIYKFRSMVPSAHNEILPRLTAKDDPRITPVGRIIRRTRVDEFPQFFNVLSGSMSIVGPRPEWVVSAERYEEIYPNFAFRTKVKAGITGFAQVFGQHNTPPEEKLYLDIMYIETFSLMQDIKLMLQTVRVIFRPSSTEGREDISETELS